MGELAAKTEFELSHLSQHVTLLRHAGLVDSHRVRTSVLCRLRDPRTAELLAVARELISNNLRHDQVLLNELDGADDAVSGAAARRASR
jgi:ArsR family transcriptional regulator